MGKRRNSEDAVELSKDALYKYLSSLYGAGVKLQGVRRLTGEKVSKDLKGFGYGCPYVIEFTVNGKSRQAVLETMRPEGFGHDYFSDRAGILLWQHSAFNKLPRHVRSVDIGAFTVDGGLKSLGDCSEFFIVTEFVKGKLYHQDLDRIKGTGKLEKLDEQRCLALSDYLAEIHKVKRRAPELYVRRIRDLIGHGEGIFGLTDSYSKGLGYVEGKFFADFEKMCVEWRWRLKGKTHRLCQVHGDFHPWNVLFREGTDFTALDRSRGNWGEPADDVTAMTINYLFYSLQNHGKLTGAFERLFLLFWKNYLDKTGDKEILNVLQPFYAWRSLVVASPLWYPNLPLDVRRKVFRFAVNVLKAEKFDFEDVNSYLK